MDKTVLSKYQKSKEKGFFISLLLGILAAAGAGLVLILVSSFIGLRLSDPDKYTPVLALISIFASSFFGGYIMSRLRSGNGLACGITFGLCVIAVVALMSLLFEVKLKMSLFAICAPSILVTSVFAGISGAKRSSDKSFKPKHKKIKF